MMATIVVLIYLISGLICIIYAAFNQDDYCRKAAIIAAIPISNTIVAFNLLYRLFKSLVKYSYDRIKSLEW